MNDLWFGSVATGVSIRMHVQPHAQAPSLHDTTHTKLSL